MATHSDDLLAVSSEIDAYDEKKIVSIGMPYKHYMQEIQLACNRLIKYQSVLSAGNMDFTRVEKLKTLNGACRELCSGTAMTVFSSSVNQKLWESKKEEADILLYDIKEAAIYACRDNEQLLNLVYSIYNEGGSNTDTIQDLNDYALLGRTHRELFEAIGYDMANFERAAELSREMNDLLAIATLDKSDSPDQRIRRDKAFTITKQLIDDLHAQARFIFRKEKLLAAEFIIRPPRKKNKKKTEEKQKTHAAV